MTDPIERRIAGLNLPEPTPDLDRRIDDLLAMRRLVPATKRPRRFGLLGVAAVTLAAGFLGFVLGRASRTAPVDPIDVVQKQPEPPFVKTVEFAIPTLDLSLTETVYDQDRLLPGTIVVSTNVQQEEMK